MRQGKSFPISILTDTQQIVNGLLTIDQVLNPMGGTVLFEAPLDQLRMSKIILHQQDIEGRWELPFIRVILTDLWAEKSIFGYLGCPGRARSKLFHFEPR